MHVVEILLVLLRQPFDFQRQNAIRRAFLGRLNMNIWKYHENDGALQRNGSCLVVCSPTSTQKVDKNPLNSHRQRRWNRIESLIFVSSSRVIVLRNGEREDLVPDLWWQLPEQR